MIEVILKEPVDHLGHRGDVVKVADGYARNYLLPRKLALAVTAGNKRQIDAEKKRASATRSRGAHGRRRARVAPRAGRSASSPAASARRTRSTARSRRPTSPRRSARLGFEIDKRKMQLAEPIKALGEYSVPVRLHRDVTAQVKVLVVKAD